MKNDYLSRYRHFTKHQHFIKRSRKFLYYKHSLKNRYISIKERINLAIYLNDNLLFQHKYLPSIVAYINIAWRIPTYSLGKYVYYKKESKERVPYDSYEKAYYYANLDYIKNIMWKKYSLNRHSRKRRYLSQFREK